MKSGKQRRLEIKERRRKRALATQNTNLFSKLKSMPKVGAIEADHKELEHNNTYGLLPLFYIDKCFSCKKCSSEEIWTAKQQKWWYETAKGHIDSTAVHCRRCRKLIREEKSKQKEHMKAMAEKERHPNEAFFKKKL